MGRGDSSSSDGGCGDDVAAYVLGALQGDEQARFEHHVKSCAVCLDELTAFRQIVDSRLLSVAARPAPDDLRRRLMAEVSRDATRDRDNQRGREARGFRLWRPPSLGPRNPRLILSVVLFAVVLAVGGLELGASVAGGPEVFHAHARGASAEVRVSGGRAELMVRHFAPPPAGQIYEAWLDRPHRAPLPTRALFSVTARGNGTVDVPGNLDGVAQVMATQEPAGGSQAPTRPATITVNLG